MARSSWVVTVETAGTAVQGPSTGPGVFLIGTDPANTGYIYIGNDGEDDVASTTGHKLSADKQTIVTVSNMNEIWFDASVNGEKATILRVEAYGG